MKRAFYLVIVLLLCLAEPGKAQNFPRHMTQDSVTHKFTYHITISIKGNPSRAELFERAQNWCDGYNPVQDTTPILVIQALKDSGMIVAERFFHNVPVPDSVSPIMRVTNLHCMMMIQADNGRYSCTLSDFQYGQIPLEEIEHHLPYPFAVREDINAQVKTMLSSLQHNMQKPVKKSKKKKAKK